MQEEFSWINECGSKARKKAIVNAQTAYKRFFNGQSKFPRFKKKKNQDVKMYFPKNNKGDWTVKRHKIQIPTLGFVELKEKGYIPTNTKVVSGTVSMKAGRYYVSVLCEIDDRNDYSNTNTEGLGIDLGIKDLATVSSIDKPFKSINKTEVVRKLKKKLKRLQRQVSRKYEMSKDGKKFIKTKNIIKLEAQIRTLHQRLSNIRLNYAHNITNTLVKTKPGYITIEDLNCGTIIDRDKNASINLKNAQKYIVA